MLKLRNGTAMIDFAWVRDARHVAIAPGTFGWWASYLGSADSVYYPARPSSALPWCLIMPTDDPRFIFLGGGASELEWRGGAEGSHLARLHCLQASSRPELSPGWHRTAKSKKTQTTV